MKIVFISVFLLLLSNIECYAEEYEMGDDVIIHINLEVSSNPLDISDLCNPPNPLPECVIIYEPIDEQPQEVNTK